MKNEKILIELENCLDYGDTRTFGQLIKNYLKTCDEETASQKLAVFIAEHYTHSGSEAMAKYMEIILRCNPNLGLIKYPENKFFLITIATGSLDLFDCYTEEVIEPHLGNVTDDERKKYYKDLLHLGAELSAQFSSQYEKKLLGLDYNEAFAVSENYHSAVVIHQEDYDIMCDMVYKYNTLIGRRDVLKALMMKVGMIDK